MQAQLEAVIRERKQHEECSKVFEELQGKAKQAGAVVNVFNDPNLSRQHPGVAARIIGNDVTIHELAERCIERHGEEVLEGTINRRLLEQACKKQNITVTEADLDEEIARAAAAMVKPKPDGSPDVDAWVKMNTEEQKHLARDLPPRLPCGPPWL